MVYRAQRSFVHNLKLIMGQGAFANACWDGTSNEQDLANGNVLKRPQINFFYTIT